MKQRAIRGGMITSASQGILFFLRLGSIVVLARMLIPEHFGLIGMVASLTVLIERFQDLGLGDAIVQKKEITHEQVSTLFWINLGICIFLSIVVSLCAKGVAWFYHDQRLTLITIAFASNFVFSGLSIQHQALIRRQMRFDLFALIQIITNTFGVIVSIVLAWKGYGYWALVWKELARTLLNTVMAWILCPWRPGLPVRNSGVKSMLKFGGNVTGFNMLSYFTNNLDSILLGKFCGAVPVGLYSRAKQLTTMPVSQLLEPIRYISLPALSALQNDPAKYRTYFEKMLAVLSFLYMPIIVYTGIFSHPIVFLALGSQWMDAVPIFRLLAISTFATPVVAMLGTIMLASGKTKRYFFWGVFTSFSVVAAYVVGIKWGVLGISASCAFATAANLIFSMLYVFKGTPLTIRCVVNGVYKPVITSITMGIVLLLAYHFLAPLKEIMQIVLSILLGGGIYFGTWLLFPQGYKNLVEFISYPLSALRHKKINVETETH
jgi:O-antigen/teichoic acid export membrane protein